PLANRPKELIAKWNRKQKFMMLGARTSAATILLSVFMLVLPVSGTEEEANPPATTAVSNSQEEAAPEQQGAQTGIGTPTQQSNQPGLQVAFVKPAGENTMGKALSALLKGTGGGQKTGIAAMLQQEGKWRRWTGDTRLLAMTKRQGEANPVAVNLLDGA